MATHKLHTIIVTEDHNTWSEGDIIISYWDDSTEEITATKNDIAITSGEILTTLTRVSANLQGSFYRRELTGYTFKNSDNNTVNFLLTFSFPYVKKDIIYDNPGDDDDDNINDLEIKSVTITNATSKTSQDGKIEVTAKGTQTVEWELDNFNYGSGLSVLATKTVYAGNYTVWLKNSIGQFVTRQIYVPYKSNVYGVRWRYQFTSCDNTEFRIDILERDYSGTPDLIKGGGNPITISPRGEGGDFYNTQLLPTQANLDLVSDSLFYFVDIAKGDDEKHQVKYYKDVSSAWSLEWQGFISPSTYLEDYGTSPHYTSVTAYDRLGDLKNIKFIGEASENDDGKSDYKSLVLGELSDLQVLNFCLTKLNHGFGYRIAINIFESSHSTSNTTPLSQTYNKVDHYANINGNEYSPENCAKVVKDILNKYGAFVTSRNGYWYIIRWKELVETVNYVEYDKTLDFIQTGSWNPIVDFKRPDVPIRFRWQGGLQSLSFTEIYKQVNIVINTFLKTQGALRGFNETTIQFPFPNNEIFKGLPTGFEGVSLKKNNPLNHFMVKKESATDYNYGWFINLSDINNNSDSYLQYVGDLTYVGSDKLRIYADLENIIIKNVLDTGQQLYMPYITMKWSLKLGDKYLTTAGGWTTSESINEYYLELEGDQVFNVIAEYPKNSVTTETYVLNLYIPNIYESHLSSDTRLNLYTALRAVSTINLPVGTRYICKYGAFGNDLINSSYGLHFYELVNESYTEAPPDIIQPNDHGDPMPVPFVGVNEKQWRRVATSYINSITTPNVGVIFYNVKLEHLPEGSNPDDTLTISQSNNPNNKLILDHELNSYDLTNEKTNEENTYQNFLKKSDSSPTTAWSNTGETVTKSIQNHLLDWIVKLTKISRFRISGEYKTDTAITPLNVLRDPTDNNRIFYPLGVVFNDKEMSGSGEFLELSSDESITTSAYDNSVDQNAHN